MNTKRLFVRFAVCFVLAARSTPSLLAQQSWTTGTFSYDAAGNITAIGNDTYFYDTAGRLVHGTAEGSANFQYYSYDGFGNRLTANTTGKNCAGNVTCGGTVSVNTNNRIDSAGFSYDTAGNMQTSGGSTYGYDGAGMMSSLTAPNGWRYDYIYTADDERIATYTGNGNWQFTIRGLDGRVLREMTAYQPAQGAATWTWSRDHVWRDGQLLATVSPSGTEQFHLDHLGTPRIVTDATGHKIGYHAYYPFGEELNLSSDESPLEKLEFTGHERDTVLSASLDYMHARSYGAGAGRFFSPDPDLNSDATKPSPQKWNRYSYVLNNPLLYADTTGRQEHAGFAMDRDIQEVMAHRMTEREYWARLNARGVGAAIGAAPWAGLWGVRAIMSLFGVASAVAVASGGGGSVILLGENMADRVEPLAEELQLGPAATFNQPWVGTLNDMLAKNMAWLQSKIDSGARIIDIGRDLMRANPSPFYSAEVNLLEQNGYTRSFLGLKMVNGTLQAVYEWTKVQ